MALDPYSLPPLSEMDPGDPILAEHGTKFHYSISHCHGALGGNNYVLEEDHDHDGLNSRGSDLTAAIGTLIESQVGAGIISRAKLKTAVTQAATTNLAYTAFQWSVSGYSFYPTVWGSSGQGVRAKIQDTNYTTAAAAVNCIEILTLNNAYNANFHAVYIDASPPFAMGGRSDWGAFVWLLCDASETPVAVVHSSSPPWSGLLPHLLDKMDPEKVVGLPHPFGPIDGRPLPDDWLVQLIDLGAWQEEVEFRPEQSRRQHEERRAARLEALGLEVSDLAVRLGQAHEAERREVEQQERANQLVARVHERLEEVEFNIVYDGSKKGWHQDVVEARLRRARAQAAARLDHLRVAAGRLTRIEAAQHELAMAGSTIPDAVLSGREPSGLAAELRRDILEAGDELPALDRHYLPRVEPFRARVRVLRRS